MHADKKNKRARGTGGVGKTIGLAKEYVRGNVHINGIGIFCAF